MELAEACYRVAADPPLDERYGLALQIRRAAVSIPASIAEGHNGRTRQVFLNHLAIALGSQAELETELELVQRLLHIDSSDAKTLAIEVGKLLHGLISALEHSAKPKRPSVLVSIPSH